MTSSLIISINTNYMIKLIDDFKGMLIDKKMNLTQHYSESITRDEFIQLLKCFFTFNNNWYIIVLNGYGDKGEFKLKNNTFISYREIKSTFNNIVSGEEKRLLIICDFFSSEQWVDECKIDYEFRRIYVQGTKCFFYNKDDYEFGVLLENLITINSNDSKLKINFPEVQYYEPKCIGFHYEIKNKIDLFLMFSSWKQMSSVIEIKYTPTIKEVDNNVKVIGYPINSVYDYYLGELYSSNNILFYQGELNNNSQPHGLGIYYNRYNTENSEIFTYFGEFFNGLFEGYGIEYHSNKLIEGFYVKGLKEGNLTEINNEFKFITHTIKNDEVEEGLIYYNSGGFYEGKLLNKKPHGFGKDFNFEQGQYTGWFNKGVKNGQGEIIYTTGSRLTTSFKDGEINGYGEYIPYNNDIVETEFYNLFKVKLKIPENLHIISIKGKFSKEIYNDWLEIQAFIILNNSTDVNCLDEEMKVNITIYAFTSNEEIIFWICNKYTSFNKSNTLSNINITAMCSSFDILSMKCNSEIIYQSKDIYTGMLLKGIRNGIGYYYNNLKYYEYYGFYVNGCKEGYGILIHNQKNFKYEGFFLKGKFHGKGKVDYTNGDSIEGEFNKGLFEGKFMYKYSNGNILICYYKQNKLLSKGIFYERYYSGLYDKEGEIITM